MGYIPEENVGNNKKKALQVKIDEGQNIIM